MPKFCVSGASWDRIYLNITVSSAQEASKTEFYFINKSGRAFAKLEKAKTAEGEYCLRFNVTNTGSCRCLPDGEYYLVSSSDGKFASLCAAEKDVSSLSRRFYYHSGKDAYNISFSGGGCFKITCSNESFKKGGAGIKSKLLNLKTVLMQILLRFIYRVSRKKGKGKDTILFMSEQSRTAGGNLTAVYSRMLERQLDKKFTIIKSFRNAVSEHQGISNWVNTVRKIAASSTIILDDHAPVFDWLVLKDTKVIQLWHAGAGFKSAGYSRWGSDGCPPPFSCHRQYTYGISGSKRIAHFFSEVFGINTQQVLPTGMPRMDEYLDPDYKTEKVKELYEKYPLCRGKKVILFAPTYRGVNNADAYYPYDLIDFKKLYETCGGEYVVLFKMHPFIKAPVPIPAESSSRLADAGEHPNINDLFYITDLLITDYSSNIFEFSLQKKPMLFFAFDQNEYSSSRGFHRDYEKSVPGRIVRSFDELIEVINSGDFEIEKVYNYIDVHFDHVDPYASDRVIDWLILDDMPEDLKKAIDGKNADVTKTLGLKFTIDELK